MTSSGIVTHLIGALIIYENMPECHPSRGVWGSLFKTEAYHSQGAKEAAEVGGRGTFSAFPMHLIHMALSRDGLPAALREVKPRVRASKLSVLKRDPHTPGSGPAAEKPRSLVRGASL